MFNSSVRNTRRMYSISLDEGYGIHAIFLDYRKAFDTVPHKRLISKLKGYGVRGQLLQWTEDFLANRKMRVLLRYDTIEEFNVDSKAEY